MKATATALKQHPSVNSAWIGDFIRINHHINIGVAVAYDFNHDGYPDLFVGGRSVPREYGSSPSSYLFVNNGAGHFTDIASAKNKDIANIGMVTGAVWADVEGDIEALSMWAGQGVSLVRKLQPAAQIVREIHDEASSAYNSSCPHSADVIGGDCARARRKDSQ